MSEKSLILPAISPNSLRKADSLHSLKFKKITQPNEQIQIERKHSQKQIFKQYSTTLNKREKSSTSIISTLNRKELINQKMVIGLAQKKIRQGRYNQNEQISTDLNNLKITQSDYIVKITNTQHQISKIVKMINDIKGQKSRIQSQQQQLQQKLNNIKIEVEQAQHKCNQILFDKQVSSTILKRQLNDYNIIQGRVNKLKDQVQKKKNKESLLDKKQIILFEKQKQTQRQCRNLRKNYLKQTKKLQDQILDKEKSIQLRAKSQIERWKRKKDLIHISQSVIIQQAQKAFDRQYYKIITNKLISTIMSQKLNRLIQNNKKMQDLFNQASNMYGPLTPEQYPFRYFNSSVQRQQIQHNIKKLQESIKQKEKKNNKLEQRMNDLKAQYLQLGLLIEKQENSIQAQRNVTKISSDKVYQKIGNIDLWIKTSIDKLYDSGFQFQPSISKTNNLNYILFELQKALLQQTK